MKAVNVDDVFKILNWYGQFIFITDNKRYTEMMDEIANLPSTVDTMLDKIRVELHATAEMHEDNVYYLREEWIDEIINKHKMGDKE